MHRERGGCELKASSLGQTTWRILQVSRHLSLCQASEGCCSSVKMPAWTNRSSFRHHCCTRDHGLSLNLHRFRACPGISRLYSEWVYCEGNRREGVCLMFSFWRIAYQMLISFHHKGKETKNYMPSVAKLFFCLDILIPNPCVWSNQSTIGNQSSNYF